MIAIGVKSDGPIEVLLVGLMHLHVVLRGHHVVVVLPVLDHLEVILDLHHLLHRLADFLNDPTLVHKISMLLLFLVDRFNGYKGLMRRGIGGILDLTDDIRILRLRVERYVFGFYADGLIEILLVECVVLLIVLAIGHVESVIPSPRV